MESYAWYFLFPIFVFFIATFLKEKKWSGIFVLISMLFFSMFRGDLVGTDTIHYLEQYGMVATVYSTANDAIESNHYELIYYALCIFIKSYQLPPRLIIYFFSIITISFLYFACKRYKQNYTIFATLYIFLTIYLLSFNISRQCAAASICLYATSFLMENGKKKFLFLIWLLIAALIHTSAVITLLVYPFTLVKSKRQNVGTIVLLISVFLCLFPVASIIFNYLPNVGLTKYFESYSEKAQNSSIIGVFYNIFIIFWGYYMYGQASKSRRIDLMDALLLFMMLGWGALSNETSLAINRIKVYFNIYFCLYSSRYFYDIRTNSSKQVIWILMIIMWYYFLVQMSLGYEPYYMQFSF